MNRQKARAYILDTTAIQSGQTLEKLLCYMRNRSVILVFGLLLMLFFGAFVTHDAHILWIIASLAALLLVAISAAVTFKRNKYLVHSYTFTKTTTIAPRKFNYVAGWGTLAGVGGMFLMRTLGSISYDMMVIISVVGTMPILVLFTNIACTAQYKLYLLRKYCPEIKNVKG